MKSHYKSVAITSVFLCSVNLASTQVSTPPPPTANASVDIKRLDRYFDAEPIGDGIGGNMATSRTNITIEMITGKNEPELIAVFVGRGEEKDPDNSEAQWMPFQRRVMVDLGEGDGPRHIFVAARWKASDTGCEGTGWGMTVLRSAPAIHITEPATRIVSQPVIQLKGYSPRELERITYDVLDQGGQMTVGGEDGFVTDSHFDPEQFEFTTNYFQCFDIELTPGTNTVVLRCEDLAGNSTTTNLLYVFTTAGDKEPPVFVAVDWPKPEAVLSGRSFTARGRLDAYTGDMTGQIISHDHTNNIRGFAERNGYFWFDEVPLATGPNHLNLTAIDAAGNAACTNLVVYGVEGPELTMDPLSAEEQEKLWDGAITVKGRVNPANYDVQVNGVQAVVRPDGTWVAEKVPVILPTLGTASFEMTATPVAGMPTLGAGPEGRLFTHATLGSNAMILNASSPACGVFQLHLIETAGHAFVLFTSTNLSDWSPILTNVNPATTFDYTDTNASASRCRFYRVVPLP